MDTLIASLNDIFVQTGDYFNDELEAQLNVTKSWLEEAMVTIRQHELQRLSLIDLISQSGQRGTDSGREMGGCYTTQELTEATLNEERLI